MERILVCSYNVQSMLRSGLIAGGRERKEGRQTIFFTPLNPFGDNPDEEEPRDDLSKPRKATLSQQVEASSGRRPLDQFSPITRRRTTVLTNQIPCHNCSQLCAGILHRQSDFSKRGKNLKDVRRLVLPRR